jgi:hypothetical protein
MSNIPLDKSWRPAGILYLFMCLAGFLCGLWPQAIYISPDGEMKTGAPLPVLQALVVSQVVYFLLIYPLVVFRRPDRRAAVCLLELAALAVMTIPFYSAAAALSDSTATDCIRAGLLILAMCPLSIAAGRLMKVEVMRTAVLLGLCVVCLGLVPVYYIFIEFIPGLESGWCAHIAPVIFAWNSCASRGDTLMPIPIWPSMVWLALGAAALLVSRGRGGEEAPKD